jgi:MEMO1 family protein
MSSDSMIAAGYIMPHPPIIVPGVNRGPHLASRTVQAMNRLADDFAAIRPETVIVISPHAPMFSDYLFFYDAPVLKGDLSRFGAPEARLSLPEDSELSREITELLESKGVQGGKLTEAQMRRHQIEQDLDHGVVVPLYFLAQAYSGARMVAISSSNLPLPTLYQVGGLLREAAMRLKRRVVIIASGDQSHKVNDESPYGSTPEGSQYDNQVVQSLKNSDLVQLLSISSQVRQRAAECGYRSLVMLSGAFAGQAVKSEVLSYEAPYGIGYCVAAIRHDASHPQAVPDAWQQALDKSRQTREHENQDASAPVRIARRTLESYVREHKRTLADEFRSLQDSDFLFQKRAGVFVSLKKFGELRGCIGTTAATTASLADEIIQNSLSAGLHDPRFEPVRPDELADLTYSVDVLGDPEPISDRAELNPAVYGVIVRYGSRSGLLLPDLEGVDTVEDQLAIACRKAGIQPNEPYRIMRFQVTRYH